MNYTYMKYYINTISILSIIDRSYMIILYITTYWSITYIYIYNIHGARRAQDVKGAARRARQAAARRFASWGDGCSVVLLWKDLKILREASQQTIVFTWVLYV